MLDKNRPVIVEALIVPESETEFAVALENETGRTIWLPKTEIELLDKDIDPETGAIIAAKVKLPFWLAEKEQLDWEEVA